MRIETLLEEEIQDEFDALNEMEKGTDTYKATVDGVTKLMDRAIEIQKLNTEAENRVKDDDLKQKQLNEERIDRLVKNCLTAAGIIIPTVVTVWGTLVSFKFEQEGTVTTIMGRGFINKLLPKK